FVRQGYIAMAPESRGFGERADHEGCYQPAVNSILLGVNLMGRRVWDVLCALDYLESRPEVDRKRIACVGLSMGGWLTMFVAGLDKRIRATVLSGSFSSFRDSFLGRLNCACGYTTPGIAGMADIPDLASLIAPRSLLIQVGTHDPQFSVTAVRKAFRTVQKVYRLLGTSEKVCLDVFEGGHMFHGETAFQWLERWL
ncbi:MAG: prolyl oligopeptidase family serine peptidase, partial [Chloroflexi bacterium]|nr:prolyl oligopeptidase family serine peptidase [Chloroflexota bacterium]